MVQDPNNNTAEPQDGPVRPPQSSAEGDGANVSPPSAAESEVESLRKELDAMKDRYLRALADCQNIQKRAAAERNEAVQRGQADLVRALLPVLDNFERTVQAAGSAGDVKTVVEGIRIVHDQLLKVLGEFGLERMALAKGDPFDPVYHQAVAQQPTDEVDPEHVLHVAQAGYTMRDRTLRAATVVVGKALPAPQEQGQGRDE